MNFQNLLKKIYESWQAKPLPVENEIQRAISNLRLLIFSASENAIAISDEHLYTVTECRDLLKKGELPPTKEAEFWIAYRTIAEEVYPITISSIRANYDPHQGEISMWRRLLDPSASPLSRRCASRYKVISVVTLILLITVQIYWYIGVTLTNDISAQSATVTNLQSELFQMKAELEVSEGYKEGRTTDPRAQKIAEMESRIKEHGDWKDAAVNHLQNWNTVWSNMDLLTLQPWQIDNYSSFPTEVQRRIQFVAAGNILQAISSYILPILYGLIGACFYILRQLPKEIEELTFSMNSYIGYSLRMAQGPLAGIIISYFFTTEQSAPPPLNNAVQIHNVDANLSALSPLALCFLAGYSIEFLFKFLDKILSAAAPAPTVKQPKYINKKAYAPEIKREKPKPSTPAENG